MTDNKRTESDSIGSLDIPADAYYGVQTYRGYRNFHITGIPLNSRFIKNIVRIKKAAAITNVRAGLIPEKTGDAIVRACDEALEGKFDKNFITDSVQGGAGTSANMNVNEVIANRATELLGGKKGEYLCHPNDHVNCSQSTNDVIPTAGRLTVIDYASELEKNVSELTDALDGKATEFNDIVKMGRTQLEDAVPIRLGQEFAAYASGIRRCMKLLREAVAEMYSVNLGGTAIGTAVNVRKQYLDEIVPALASVTGYPLAHAENLIDATQNLDGFVFVSGALKTLAVSLSKMCNDLRLLSSGPKTGLEEISLPAMQNGSSIMPGKVNPVIPEVVTQVAFSVIGNDTTITLAAEAGQLELNAFEPVIFYKLFESLVCLKNAVKTLTENCVRGIRSNRRRCEELLDESVGTVTALCPYLGYKKSAELAKEALRKNVRIKDLVREKKLLDDDLLNKILNPFAMTEPRKD
ncbi:MAG: aspartate ammonia-lyase [Candidatus Borkfalkiaceae bacterium]|nr:aspartate ammonia-lyase [Christensenellaceae bacterium]